jgi:hypothetical protein
MEMGVVKIILDHLVPVHEKDEKTVASGMDGQKGLGLPVQNRSKGRHRGRIHAFGFGKAIVPGNTIMACPPVSLSDHLHQIAEISRRCHQDFREIKPLRLQKNPIHMSEIPSGLVHSKMMQQIFLGIATGLFGIFVRWFDGFEDIGDETRPCICVYGFPKRLLLFIGHDPETLSGSEFVKGFKPVVFLVNDLLDHVHPGQNDPGKPGHNGNCNDDEFYGQQFHDSRFAPH